MRIHFDNWRIILLGSTPFLLTNPALLLGKAFQARLVATIADAFGSMVAGVVVTITEINTNININGSGPANENGNDAFSNKKRLFVD